MGGSDLPRTNEPDLAWWVSGWKRLRNEKIVFLLNVRGRQPENTETEERVFATFYVQLVKVEESLVCFPGGCMTNGLNIHTLLKSNRSSDFACAVSFNCLGAVLGGYSHEFVGQVNGVLEPVCLEAGLSLACFLSWQRKRGLCCCFATRNFCVRLRYSLGARATSISTGRSSKPGW